MPTQHTVKQGECLSSIARNYGFDDWRVIYNHPDNAQFKQEHPNPNLIYPGDKLVIPDLDEGGVAGPTETKHKFEIKLDETLLRIVVQDMLDQPFGNRKFKLTFAALPLIEGTTAVDGLIETAVAPELKTGRLEVFIHGDNEPPAVWELLIGALDPVKIKSGQQARLNNLGFESGKVDNIDGPITKGAVKRFQKKHGLVEDGIVGQKTRPKLEEVHGC
jgi:N-acetylmuramoyl-L-alanine amidase